MQADLFDGRVVGRPLGGIPERQHFGWARGMSSTCWAAGGDGLDGAESRARKLTAPCSPSLWGI